MAKLLILPVLVMLGCTQSVGNSVGVDPKKIEFKWAQKIVEEEIIREEESIPALALETHFIEPDILIEEAEDQSDEPLIEDADETDSQEELIEE